MNSANDNSMRNVYLEQVVQEKAQLEEDLKVGRHKQRRMYAQAAAPMAARMAAPEDSDGAGAGGWGGARITGFWRWQNVIVPPSCYAVHTRRGHADPLHIGLGVSFRYNPVTDAFLVVPAAMQTIIIQANSICRERQGIVVQGYVQWIIDDFATAYKKLDLTDPDEPMRVVNIQLREQAEAAIKDKVATMSIDEVLADKQPIIQELTARLRHVAEGEGNGEGLGLRIVTVQIKEAIVSSPRVWESLQRPFRAERSKEARIAELSAQSIVREREIETERKKDAMEIAAASAREALESKANAERFEREQADRVQRAKLEAEALEQTIAHERNQAALQAELERMRLEHQLALEKLRGEQELALAMQRRKLENEVTPEAMQLTLIRALPEIARALPKPDKSITIGTDAVAALASSIGGLMKLVRE